MSWVLLSILATVSVAGFQMTNQYAKVNGFDLAVIVKAALAVLFLPLSLWAGWPGEPEFYLFVGLTVPLALYGDKAFFDLTAKYGAGAVTRVVPLFVIILFVVWSVSNPQVALSYLERPLIFAGIILSLSGAVYFASRMRHDAISLEAFKNCIPIMLAFTGITFFNKLAMDYSGFHEGVYGYVFFQAGAIALIGLPVMYRKHQRHQTTPSSRIFWVAVIFASITMGIHLITKNYAYALVDDPTFPTAIILTSPLFIMAYYKLTNHKEEGDILSGLGVLACVIALVIFEGL